MDGTFGSRLKHRQFESEGLFWSEFGDFYWVKSEFFCVLVTILTIETDSALSKTHGAPKIPKLDSFNLYFEKIRPNLFKILS